MNILSINIDAVNARWGIINDKYDCIENGDFNINILNSSPEESLEFISLEVKKILMGNKEIKRVVFTTPGTVNSYAGLIIDPPKMMIKWKNYPLISKFKEYCDLPALLFNESKAATMNEMKYGKLQNVDLGIYINIYSCIEGGIIFKNELVEGASGSAGEFGRQLIEGESWDAMASTFTLLNRMILMSGESNLTTSQISEFVKENDYLKEEYDKWFYKIAEGIANIILTINPKKIIIAGRIAMNKHFEISNLIRHIYKLVDKDIFEKTIIDVSNHGNIACLIGGALLWQDKYIQI